MGGDGECTWEQTYTGSCPVGDSSLVNEVEFVIRDLFASRQVSVRDVCAVLVFAIDVFDGEALEKYFVHVVARGCPVRKLLCEEALDASSSLHMRSYSQMYESGVDGAVREAMARLGRLFSSPVEGTGVSQVYFSRGDEGEVKRRVQRSVQGVAGCRPSSYTCLGKVSISREVDFSRRCKRSVGCAERVFGAEEGVVRVSKSRGCFDSSLEDWEEGRLKRRRRSPVSRFAEGLRKYRHGQDGELLF